MNDVQSKVSLTTVPNDMVPMVDAQVRSVNGVPRLFIDGQECPPLWFFANTEWPGWQQHVGNEIKLASAAGIHIYSVVTHFPLTVGQSGERDFSHCQQVLDYVLAHDPDAWIVPRIPLYPSKMAEWARTHPGETTQYVDGSESVPSMAANEFFREAEEAIRDGVAFIRNSDKYSKHVIGYHLTCGNTGEWFYYEYREKGSDYSKANERGFRQWLCRHYQLDEQELRRAWSSPAVTFDNAVVPVLPGNLRDNSEERTLLTLPKDQPVVDFYDYLNDLVVNRIASLAKVVKEMTHRMSLVVVFYGYTLDLPDPKSGHMCLGALLENRDIDIIAGPISYDDRAEGGIAGFMAPVDSVQQHGKLWMVEDDTRTHKSTNMDELDADFNPTIRKPADVFEAHKRNMGAIMVRSAGTWWMDLWGSGWYDDAEIWENNRHLRELHEKYTATTMRYNPDVAVVLDEASIACLANPSKHGNILLYDQRQAFYRAGVSFGFYLTDDVLTDDSPDAKLYIFLNPLRLSQNQRETIAQKLHRNRKTLVWVYGPGTVGQSAVDLTGMSIKKASEPGPGIIRINNRNHPLAKGLETDNLGLNIDLDPLFYVDDPNACNLGTYVNNHVGLAVRDMGEWKSIFYGSISLTPATVRALARFADVNVFVNTDDMVHANDNLVVVYSSQAGNKPITLPRKTDVYDFFARRWIGAGVNRVTVQMPAYTTKYLFYGTQRELEQLGVTK